MHMDELEISGKRYISTRRAAREHGYHSDYMGQLIRGKKVAGQKVGRAWYIEEESLNVYLGKAPAQAPKIDAPAAGAEDAPAPQERAVAEEPVAQAVAAAPVAPHPVETIIKEEPQPIVVHVMPPATAEPVMQQPVQEIHHAPYIEEQETRIPIHTPTAAPQYAGGLHYAADDAPTIPIVTRMPVAHAQAYPQHEYAPARQSGKFPYVSLSVVGVLVILAATFASNFVSATIVSEPGKAAVVQYAIHW